MKAILRRERFDAQPLCEQLPVRDYLDNVVVRTNGAFVAGYELRGIHSYFASDQERNQNKLMLDALLRTLPEQSMRLQVRFEMVEDLGDLLDRYQRHSSEDKKFVSSTRFACGHGQPRWDRDSICGLFCMPT